MPDAPSYPPPGPTDSPGPDPHAPFRPPTSSGASYAPSYPTQQPVPHAPYGGPGWQQVPPHAPQQKPGGAVGVVALVLACVPLVVTNIVGIVLGIMGLARGREGRAGYGTSLAAVVVGTTVLSLFSVVGLVVALGAEDEPGTTAGSSGDDGDSGSGPADDVWEDDLPEWERPVDMAVATTAFGDLQPGDCYWDDGFWEAMYPDAPEEVDVVPCDEVHGLQVLGSYELDLEEWPGRMDMYDETDLGCGDLFFELTTEEYVDAYETWWVGYGPDRDAFEAGERAVTCVFVHDELIDESAVLPFNRGA